MKARKTVEIQTLKDKANKIFVNYSEKDCSKDYLFGVQSFVADILMASGNYKGYRYLRKNEVPTGERPGLNDDMSFVDTDSFRIKFF